MSGKPSAWVVALMCVAVLVSGVGLTLVIGFLVIDFSIGDDDFGPKALDAEAAERALEGRRVSIPDGFTFESMTESPVFTGAAYYAGRYSVTGSLDYAKHALAESNPDFPALRRATCDDEIVSHDFPGIVGFSCGANSELAGTTRSLDDKDVLTDNYAGTPPDAETLLLVGNGDHVDLFVISEGH